MKTMAEWVAAYFGAQRAVLAAIRTEEVCALVGTLREAMEGGHKIFVFGNGGSAANASHFATDLGKGASDKLGKRFAVLCLNDNTSWLTALGNDYGFEDSFVGQLENYATAGDVAIGLSVSGSSANCVKALGWGRRAGLRTVALVGGKRGQMADVAEQVIVIEDTHYGRVEDAEMGICHAVAYAFMEQGVS
jgi:D-sedoheptulose 7-phosphate isomerase